LRAVLGQDGRVLGLATLILALFAGLLVFSVLDLVSVEDVRSWVDAFGPLAPLAYVPMSALLGMALVPGPILAGASGLLFGAAVGTAVTLASATLSAVLALLVARHAGRDGARQLGGERLEAAERLLERHGTGAVVAQRLMPGVPDAPCSYAAGLVGITVAQIAVGTVIGSAPRAFSYTAIGASLDDPASPLALAGILALVATTIVGAEVARRAYRDRRG
jgi:uncharacterized membrane protein YdjX (TVP38/TMEM64 family)